MLSTVDDADLPYTGRTENLTVRIAALGHSDRWLSGKLSRGHPGMAQQISSMPPDRATVARTWLVDTR